MGVQTDGRGRTARVLQVPDEHLEYDKFLHCDVIIKQKLYLMFSEAVRMISHVKALRFPQIVLSQKSSQPKCGGPKVYKGATTTTERLYVMSDNIEQKFYIKLLKKKKQKKRTKTKDREQ